MATKKKAAAPAGKGAKSKSKKQIKDLEAKDEGNVKGGMNKHVRSY